MTIETATYISSLNSANPGASDAISEGDDHIRLLKSTIKATFPNVAGAATPSHTELNYVTGVTSAIQTGISLFFISFTCKFIFYKTRCCQFLSVQITTRQTGTSYVQLSCAAYR